MQYAKLMLDYDHGRLPKAFENVFTKISDIHTHRTRSSVKGNLVKISIVELNHMEKHLVSKY